MKGVFFGGGFKFFGVQCLGVAATIAWTAIVITIVFSIIKATIGLRAEASDEVMGLDRSEHGLHTAYSGFSIMLDAPADDDFEPAPVAIAAPLTLAPATSTVPPLQA